jgi:glycosyltransferase involved in cell wall biosynthesis
MYESCRVAVVVPAYDEAGLVGDVIETVPEYVDYVYAIDDCSTDGTWAEIRQRCTHVLDAAEFTSATLDDSDTDEQVVVGTRHEENAGRGRCIKKGYRRALVDDVDVVAVMDGDGQMDPAQLERIVDPVAKGRADYTKGTRLANWEHVADMSNWRLFGNVLLSLLTNLASGYWGLLDSQNGYTAISRSALEAIPIDALYDRYGFLNDLLTTLNVHGLRLAEVPHPAVYDEEESGIAYSTFVPAVSALLLRNFLYRLQQRYLVEEFHATIVCYGVGTAGLAAGTLAGLAALLTGGAVLVGAVSASLTVVAGVVFFLLGVALDVQQNADLTYLSDSYSGPSGHG